MNRVVQIEINGKIAIMYGGNPIVGIHLDREYEDSVAVRMGMVYWKKKT